MSRLVVCVLLIGCTRASGPAPNSAVRGWLAAQSRDDPRAAWRTLSRAARPPENEFAARWRASAEERRGQASALGPLASRPPSERARGLWTDGREVLLVREPAGWRMSTPRIASPGAASPEDAVRRFADALERHDLDGLLDLMADPLRGQLERELADRLSRVKASLHKDIQVEGNRARIRLDERYYLDLTRENGRWRVSDFN